MKPFQNMVVGYDGSPDALNAVTWALDAARAVQANVTIVHAIGLIEHMHEHLSRDTLPTALVALAQECDFDTAALQWLVEDGDACSVMLRMTDPPVNAEVLVVGSRGEGKREGLLLGSTSLELVEHSPVPVVVVHRVSPSVEHVRTSMVGFVARRTERFEVNGCRPCVRGPSRRRVRSTRDRSSSSNGRFRYRAPARCDFV